MRKLQQFYIPKFLSGRLANSSYNITRTIKSLKDKKELVSLADSQVLRTIRHIRYSRDPSLPQYSPSLLAHLRTLLPQSYSQIDQLLYIPEYILVTIESKKHYKEIISKGLYFNNYRYNRLLCSAGMARNNTVAFIREDFEEELKIYLKNGADPNIKISKSKYNAYFALSSTATHTVSTPTFAVVPDCEIKLTKTLDWVTETPPELRTQSQFGPVPSSLTNREQVTEESKTLDFNLFDGGGLINVTKAKEWADELQLDYIPSVFIIRNIYIKGCLFTVDFREFASLNNISELTDLYGTTHDVSSLDVILTKSQHKLAAAYTSTTQYQSLCDQYHNYWGIARVSPKQDDPYFTTNYQFLQVLNLTEPDIEELCEPTIKHLTSIAGLDSTHMLLYLLGSLANRVTSPIEAYNTTTDYLTKALMVNPLLAQDEYLRQTTINSINKKIKEAYIGKLYVKGCFSTMIPDLYAFMQHSFNLPVTGLLPEFTHFRNSFSSQEPPSTPIPIPSSDSTPKDTPIPTISCQGVGMRSPLTWRSEVNLMHFVNSPQISHWYKYITSGVIYNVWGSDCMIAADSDFDGDLIAATDNPVFTRTRYNNLPISYSKSTTPKEVIKEKTLYKADLDAFDTAIGQITNYSTSFYDLLHKFSLNSPEAKEIINRLKLTRKAQGANIPK